MKHKLDFISGAATLLDRNYLHTPTRRPPPPWVSRFLAENGIGLPAQGQHIPIAVIDNSIADWSVSERISLKAHLRAHDLVAP
jgi:hypothetical protein